MAEATDVCSRCGGAFHCGAHDPEPCPCGRVTLSRETLQRLRKRYAGCLCVRCLRELAQAPETTAKQAE